MPSALVCTSILLAYSESMSHKMIPASVPTTMDIIILLLFLLLLFLLSLYPIQNNNL